jgi:polyisoprenoid-binding protein YceI
MKKLFTVTALIVLAVISAGAQTVWKADRGHSQVGFTVIHMLVSEVEGRFTDFDATVTQPDTSFTSATVEATIKTASVNTDNEYRDKDLRSDNFFNADSFPLITFKSTKIERTGKDLYNVTGDLTIRNITRPVVLATRYRGAVVTKRGTKSGFKAMTTIDRFEFGTKWNRAIETGELVVSKDVEVTLQFEFNKVEPEVKESK